LRTFVPGHGRCGCRVLELSACCRSQPLPSTVRAGWAQAPGRPRSAEEAEAAIERRRGGRMASILLRSCRGRGPARLAPPRAASPRGVFCLVAVLQPTLCTSASKVSPSAVGLRGLSA
ncbi:leucine zipper-EF-hand containing transmembrane protein 1, isoform CRA_b, partial [Mus musculus]